MGTLVLGTASTTEDTSVEQPALASGERKTYYISGDFTGISEAENIRFCYKDIDSNYPKVMRTIDGAAAILNGAKNMLTLSGPCPAYVIKKTLTTNAVAVSVAV